MPRRPCWCRAGRRSADRTTGTCRRRERVRVPELRAVLTPRQRGLPCGGRPPDGGGAQSRRMARMAMSSGRGPLEKSLAASSSDLHSTSADTPGSRRTAAAMRSSPNICRRRGPRRGRRCRAGSRSPDSSERLAARVLGVGVEHEQRSGGPQRPHLAAVPQPRRRVPGRRVAQGAGGGVEDDDAERDELLGARRRPTSGR